MMHTIFFNLIITVKRILSSSLLRSIICRSHMISVRTFLPISYIWRIKILRITDCSCMNSSTVQMHWFLIILLLPLIIFFWTDLWDSLWMITKRIQNPEAGYSMIRWNICLASICTTCRISKTLLWISKMKMIIIKSSVRR